MTDEASLDRCIPTPGTKRQLIQPADGVIDQIEFLRENVELEAHIPFLRLRATCGLMLIAHALMNLG